MTSEILSKRKIVYSNCIRREAYNFLLNKLEIETEIFTDALIWMEENGSNLSQELETRKINRYQTSLTNWSQ